MLFWPQFMKLLAAESDGSSSERKDKERALSNTIGATARSMDPPPVSETGMVWNIKLVNYYESLNISQS